MVAGNTKRIVVIKNISSNLIEEVILILKSGDDDKKSDSQETCLGRRNKSNVKNDFILKEAEGIISQYIREHRLTRCPDKHRAVGRRLLGFRFSVNTIINISMIAAILFLLLVIRQLV